MMVIFLRRSGGQPQISAFLKAQSASNTKIADAMEWALENLHADLSVDELAKRAAISPRNFSRAFQLEFRMTPGRYIEQVRVEAARLLLETTSLSIQQIAYRTGFIIPGNMRRAFVRVLQIFAWGLQTKKQVAIGHRCITTEGHARDIGLGS